jgi:hypothetical protein
MTNALAFTVAVLVITVKMFDSEGPLSLSLEHIRTRFFVGVVTFKRESNSEQMIGT